jgi:predicted nucleic acid-binding protein
MTFDTDVLIWFLRGEPNAVHLIDSAADRSISIVTLMETLQDAKSKTEMRTIRDLLHAATFRVIPLDESIGHVAAALIEEHALPSGLQVADALIAATAIGAGEVLATANVKHFRAIKSLQLKAFHARRV